MTANISNPTPRSNLVLKWTGISLLFVGASLAGSMLLTNWENWWASFIILPAAFLLSLSGIVADRQGRFSLGSRAIFLPALVIGTVAWMFLFDLNWAVCWPLMLITPTAGLLLLGLPGSKNQTAAFFQGWVFWFSLSGLLLGVEFLLANLSLLPVYSMTFNWWGLNILLVALGGLVLTVQSALRKGPLALTLINAGLSLSVAFSAVVALFNLDWNLLSPVNLMAIGLLILVSSFIRSPEQKTQA
jgi:hypothetical protein